MARRGAVGSLADLITGFNQGYKQTNEIFADFGLQDVERSKPQEVYNYATQDLPGVGPQEPGQEGQQSAGTLKARYKLFDQEQDTPFTQEQIDEAKARQRASVYRRFGNTDAASREEERLDAAKTRKLQRKAAEQNIERGGLELETLKEQRQRMADKTAAERAAAQRLREVSVNPDGSPRQPTDDEIVGNTMQYARELASKGLMSEAGQAIGQYAQAAKARTEAMTEQRKAAVTDAMARLQNGDFSGVKNVYDNFILDGGKVTSIKPGAKGTIVIERTDATGKPLPSQQVTMDGLQKGLMSIVDPNAAHNMTMQSLQVQLAQAHIAQAKAATAASGAAASRASEDQKMQREEFGWKKQDRENAQRYKDILSKDESERTPQEKQFVKGYQEFLLSGHNQGSSYVFHDEKDQMGRTTGITRGNTRTGDVVRFDAKSIPSAAGLDTVTPARPAASAPAGAAAPASAVPPPTQRKIGQVYQTPRGPLRWMGGGWAPVAQ